MKKHYLAIGIPMLLVLGLLWGTVGHGSATEDAETLRQQALELRNKARREDCKRIATRITACYDGDDGACLRLHDSIAWFTNEYRESPELSCPQKDMLFGPGDAAR